MLIECRECKQKISDRAAKCPHCGNPRPATSGLLDPNAWIAGVVVVVVLLFLMVKCAGG